MTSPFLTSQEAADLLGYKTLAGLHRGVRRYDLPCLRRGREKLFVPADLIRVWTSRRRPLRVADCVSARDEGNGIPPPSDPTVAEDPTSEAESAAAPARDSRAPVSADAVREPPRSDPRPAVATSTRTKGRQGFASMSTDRVRAIAIEGGKAAQRTGKAHRWTVDEALVAGHKGGIYDRSKPRKQS
jgi:hypothetical protein